MTTLYLPEGMVFVQDLVNATASVVPDLRRRVRYHFEDGSSEPIDESNRDQARVLHRMRLLDMISKREIVPRSPLTQVPCPDFEWRLAGRYVVTWAEAQAFCRMLAIDLQPLVGQSHEEQSQEERDAALLAQYRSLGGEVVSGEFGGQRGALAKLAKQDGRTRQTLTPMLLRAAEREAGKSRALGQVAKHLRP